MSDENFNAPAETADNANTNESNAAPASLEQPSTDSNQALSFENISAYSKEHQDFLKSKGYKDVPALIESYRSLERKIGTSLALPKDDDAEDVWTAFYKKTGAPDTVEGYGVKPVSQMQTDLLNVAAKLHLDKKRALQLIDLADKSVADEDAAEAEQFKKDCDELFASWGENRAANVDLLNRGRNLYQVSDAKYQEIAAVLGVKAAANMFVNLGKNVSDGFSNGRSTPTNTSNETSLAEDFYAKRARK